MSQRIWFITGVSRGLGQAIAREAIRRNDIVIGTFRTEMQAENFSQESQNAYGLVLDVTNPEQVKQAATFVIERFGRIDVLVNNAGVGFAGAVEETSMQEARALFEVNFWGALAVTQALLPLFRRQHSGHIMQISSHGGFKAFAGFGIYNATKFALEGISEALAAEISPLGIKLTIVEPGPFRTGFAGDGFQLAEMEIPDYGDTAGLFRQRIKGVDGKQEGDPERAARVLYDVTLAEYPPLRLPLGKVALASIDAKLESVQRDIAATRNLASSVVFS